MYSSSREEIVEAFDALEADFDRALKLSFDALTIVNSGLALRSDSAMRAVATSADNQAVDCWQSHRLGDRHRHRPLAEGCDATVFTSTIV